MYNKEQELELWKRWKISKNQYELSELIKSFQPLINKEVNKYSGNLDRNLYYAEALKLFMQALESYDPNRGAALATHITSYMNKLYRFNLTYQNVGRIRSERRPLQITAYHNTMTVLEDKFGRPPTTNEVAEEMQLPHKEVARIRKDLRKDLSLDETFDSVGLGPKSNPMYDRMMQIYHFETTPEEKLVLEYLQGIGGKPIVSSNIDIAKRLNMTPNRVSKMRTKLYKKITGE
jgi:DNA-directed RNA polymerase specialized sigma subunit